MSEFHDNYPQYEVMSNHGEEEGRVARKILWRVFWVMLFITIFELVVGFMAPSRGWSGTWWLKTLFIGLTVIKAAAIVMWFMHLGHEVKFFKYAILSLYIGLMCYTIFVVLTEGVYAGRTRNVTKVDPIFVEQQEALKNAHGANHGSEHETEAHH